MGHIVDFAGMVRGVGASEYTGEDALMAMTMEVATRESAMKNGVRLDLPLERELEFEATLCATQKTDYGIDLLDIEGMLAISYPRPRKLPDGLIKKHEGGGN